MNLHKVTESTNGYDYHYHLFINLIPTRIFILGFKPHPRRLLTPDDPRADYTPLWDFAHTVLVKIMA
jgi:hypothetical protein